MDYSLKGKKVWVAGHTGLVGSALVRRLSDSDCDCEVLQISHKDLDLRNQSGVKAWMNDHKPDAVIVAAAHVGGIMANRDNPASFFYDNIMIATNIIHSAYEAGVEKLLFLGSSCIYPKVCAQPITEDALLGGALEPTNEAYALAKIGALKMTAYYRRQYGCDFISAMPCNLFGVGDTYDARNSHVIPALIMKAHHAMKQRDERLTLWGTGKPLREFLYVDDLADALVYLLRHYSGEAHINVGTGTDISVKDMARVVCDRIGYKGKIEFDTTKPDGTMVKRLDVSLLQEIGWKSPSFDSVGGDYTRYLAQGIDKAYADFLQNNSIVKAA